MTIYCEDAQKASDKNIISFNVPYIDVKKENLWLETCSPKYFLLVVLLLASLLASLTTLVVFIFQFQVYDTYKTHIKEHHNIQKTMDRNTPTLAGHLLDSNTNHAVPENLTIITRKEWLAQPPLQEVTLLHLPVPYVIIMHTATGNCSVQSSCSLIVHAIQNFHTDSRGWSDIGYNFLVGGDGLAYEGRGWENQGAHTYGYNSKSIGIAFMGNFNAVMPTKQQIIAAKKLIQLGVEEGYIIPNYKLFAARQLQATQSPGLMLYEDVQKWPHWTKHEKSN